MSTTNKVITVKVYRYDLWSDGDGGWSVNDVHGQGSFDVKESSWGVEKAMLAAARRNNFTIPYAGTIVQNCDQETTMVVLDKHGQCVGEFRRE